MEHDQPNPTGLCAKDLPDPVDPRLVMADVADGNNANSLDGCHFVNE